MARKTKLPNRKTVKLSTLLLTLWDQRIRKVYVCVVLFPSSGAPPYNPPTEEGALHTRSRYREANQRDDGVKNQIDKSEYTSTKKKGGENS